MFKTKRILALMLALTLLVGLALPAAAAEGLLVKDGTFTYRSAFLKDRQGKEKTLKADYHYDENWFLADSSIYDHDLATMSLSLSMAAAMPEEDAVEDMFEALKFTDTTIDYPTPTRESIGYAIGSKEISGPDGTFTLMAVVIRGAGYEEEWADNFRIGAGETHEGFQNSANKVLAAIYTHVQNHSLSGDVKVWLTGYSRGAAVANITAHELNVASRAGLLPGVTEEGIYAYCFEVPQAATHAAVDAAPMDNNIFNINNPMDVIPMIAPSNWDYTNYGVTYHYPSPATEYAQWSSLLAKVKGVYKELMLDAGLRSSEAESTVETQMKTVPAQQLLQKQVVEIVATHFQNPENYTENYQDIFMEAMATCFGQSSDIQAAVPLVYEILPFMIFQHRALANTLMENAESLAQMHYPELTYSWMHSIDAAQLQKDAKTRQLTVNGSADIALYDSGNTLAAKITGGVVQTVSGSSIEAFVDENGQQIITIPLGESFRVELTPKAEVLSWQMEEYDYNTSDLTELVRYDDIAVTSGTVLQGSFPAEGGCSWEGIQPTRQAEGEDIRTYTLTVTQQGGQDNITGGGYFTEGEFAQITANPGRNDTFYGWYANGELVSSERTYRFRMEQDLTVTAWFEEYTAPPAEEEPEEPVELGLSRVAGGHRYETAFQAADRMKQELGLEKFETVVVASGVNFADALSGSYLAAVRNAPILLACDTDWVNEDVKEYIAVNLTEGGTVYILGGVAAVPASFEEGLEKFNVERLAGADRFGTNLLILEEAGVVDEPILVCTGIQFADSLSASAAKQPILMVYGDRLTQAQADFMESVKDNPIYIIGGTGAVSEKMETALEAYGQPTRLAGAGRFQTSVLIAKEFFENPTAAMVAYAWDFPDGLCGGPLATAIGAPLLLVMGNYEADAAAYLEANGIQSGIILGGEARIPDTTVDKLFPRA